MITSPSGHTAGRTGEQSHDRDRLRLLFGQIPGAVWATDRSLRITDVMGRLRGLRGPRQRSIVGSTIGAFLGRDDPADPAIASHLAALQGESRSARYEFLGRWYDVHVEPLRDAKHEIVGVVGVGVDVTDRKESEAKLAASEARLADAQRVAHVGSWEWNLEADTISCSDELYRIYGIVPQDIGGRLEALLARVHPEDLQVAESHMFRAVCTRKPMSYNHRIVRPDGSIRMLETVGGVLLDSNGGVKCLVGTMRDVTEQWLASCELGRSLSLLRATLESTADGLLVIDRAGKITTCNRRFLSMWRLSNETVSCEDDGAVLAAVAAQLEDPESFLRRVRGLYDQPEADGFDVLRFRDGRVFERYSRPQRIGGEVVGRVWSFRDVTERERLLRSAVFLSDASRLLGSLDVEQALVRVVELVVPFVGESCAIDLTETRARPRRLLSAPQDPGRTMPVEIPADVLAGRSLIYSIGAREYMAVPLTECARVVGAITVAAQEHRRYSDTDLRLLEEFARRIEMALESARLFKAANDALQVRDEFLGIAAHEIRGPLTSIRLATQTLRSGKGDPEVNAQMLAIVEREDRRLTRFVDELKDVMQIRSGQLRFEFEQVDLTQIVRSVTAQLSAELARTGSVLSITTDGECVGTWDRGRIESVVTSLLSNAIKFGMGRPIDVSLMREAGIARLAVRDRGMGIPDTMRAAIFEPFERGVSARHYGGLGLGLYIVYSIVTRLGGTVRVETEVGNGSLFTVELPIERTT